MAKTFFKLNAKNHLFKLRSFNCLPIFVLAKQYSFYAKYNETTANLVVKLFYENDTENYNIHSDNYLFKHTLALNSVFLWLIVDYALFSHFKTRWAFMRSTCIMKMIRIYVYSHNLSNIKSFTYYEWYWCCWNKYNAMLIYKWDQNFKCN